MLLRDGGGVGGEWGVAAAKGMNMRWRGEKRRRDKPDKRQLAGARARALDGWTKPRTGTVSSPHPEESSSSHPDDAIALSVRRSTLRVPWLFFQKTRFGKERRLEKMDTIGITPSTVPTL